MAGIDFDTELFERKLQALKDSQESIQALSSWCLERRQHHKKIVATWLQVLKKVKVEHRLTLFYLANDVIQYSKRKNFEFVESWGTTLQRATTMVRDEKVKHRILRIFKIWDQRQVYDEEFLADLSGLISAAPKKKQEPQSIGPNEDFQSALLISTMRSCATLEQATDARLRDLRDSSVDVDTVEELCSSLKDRRHVEDAEKDVDVAVRNIENYVRALEAEIRERAQVLELLEQADQFYETQRGEVKIVTNAYRNFGSRVKNLKKKLDDLLPTLVSPIPSPDVNAPSPSPDSDIDLPGDENQVAIQSSIIEVAPPSIYGSYHQDYDPLPVPAPESSQGNVTGDFTSNFSSFMGGTMDFDMRNLFSDRSTTPTGVNQYNDSLEAKPIEVINMRPSKADNSNDGFNISSFLKAVLPSSEGTPNSTGIPGLGLDIPDPPPGTPPSPDYINSSPIRQLPLTPVISKAANSQSTLLGSSGNSQIAHSTPLLSSVRSLLGDSHTPSPYSSQNSQGNVSVVMAFENAVNPVNPLPPPPMPPPIFLDDENCYNKLPPKFPTWASANEANDEAPKWEEKGKNSMNPSWPGDGEEDTPKSKSHWESDSGNEHWETANENIWPSSMRSKNEVLSETPESPPMYEKAGFTDPVEYDDSQPQEPLLSSTGDVDHRVIPLPMATDPLLPHRLVKAADVDHRNLISLTGSPANNNNPPEPTPTTAVNTNNLWPSTDQDYRQQVQPGDIVESVDMEMSDDETDSKQKGRVLVDVRSQDRDMRPLLPPPAHHLDMDMRMIPLPGAQMPTSNPILPTQDSHEFHQNPPNFHRDPPSFHQNQPEFHPNQPEYHPNQPEFRPNQPEFCMNQPEFCQNQSEFRPNQPEFRLNRPEFRSNQPEFRPNQPEFRQNQPEFRPNHPDFRPNQPEFRPNEPEFRPNHPEFRQNQSDFIQNQSEFRPNKPDFRQNPPEFRANQPDFRQNQPNFLQNQSNFPQNPQEFNQKQQEFHQNQPGFDFQENPHRRRASQEFQGDFQTRGGRFPQPSEQHLRDSPGFHRNERGRGRGFPRNRRDRFSDDLNQQHSVNQSNNRRSRNPGASPDVLPNNRPFLLKPPEAVVVLDDDGNIMELPNMAQQSPNQNEPDIIRNQSPFNPDRHHGPPGMIQNQRIPPGMLHDHRVPPGIFPHQRIPPTEMSPIPHSPPTDDAPVHQLPQGFVSEHQGVMRESNREQHIPQDQCELIPETEDLQVPDQVELGPPDSEHEIPLEISQDQPDSQVESEAQLITTEVEHQLPEEPGTDTDNNELNEETVFEEAEAPTQLSEQLEALMNSNKQTNNNLKRQSANGNFTERQDEGTPNKKRTLLHNGPQPSPMGLETGPPFPGGPMVGPDGPIVPVIGLPELHPAMVAEFERPNSNPGFRPRGGGPFPPWRGGGPPRGRGGFRGGPRGPWVDRGGPRGPRDNFSPRGPKHPRGQFRGGGFRGRGRGNNW